MNLKAKLFIALTLSLFISVCTRYGIPVRTVVMKKAGVSGDLEISVSFTNITSDDLLDKVQNISEVPVPSLPRVVFFMVSVSNKGAKTLKILPRWAEYGGKKVLLAKDVRGDNPYLARYISRITDVYSSKLIPPKSNATVSLFFEPAEQGIHNLIIPIMSEVSDSVFSTNYLVFELREFIQRK